MPQTAWLINNRNLFLPLVEAGKSKIKARAEMVPGEDLPPGSWTAVFLLCPHMAEGARELSEASFIRALIPFMKTPPS